MRTGSVSLADLDFWLGDPLPVLTELRRSEPVRCENDGEFWSVLRYDDIVEVLRQPNLFSSAQGIHRKDAKGEVMKAFLSGTMILSDPPEHTYLRRVVQGQFIPRAIAALEERIRCLASERLDQLEPGQTYEFVHEVAEHVPSNVILELMGVPRQDQPMLANWLDRAAGIDVTDPGARSEVPAPQLVFEYLQQFVAERTANPADDLITRIAAPDPDTGARLSEEAILKFCFLLILAGTETTRATLSRGVHALAHHPDQLKKLLDDPSLMPLAVEEIIRWASIAPVAGRTVTSDTELAGTLLRAGEQVMVFIFSGNYDEAVFGPTASEFIVDRDPNYHIAFGFGAHICLGAPLARLETRVFLQEFLRRFQSWEVGEPEVFTNFNSFRSFKRLPLAISR